MIAQILAGISAVGSIISEPIKAWQARKTAKLQSDLDINEAKTQAVIDKVSTGQKADIAWENTSIDRAGWKDDWWTIVLSIPMVMCFIPGLVDYVTWGFEALEKTPPWYRWAVGVAIASAFGYRKIADFMALKKGD